MKLTTVRGTLVVADLANLCLRKRARQRIPHLPSVIMSKQKNQTVQLIHCCCLVATRKRQCPCRNTKMTVIRWTNTRTATESLRSLCAGCSKVMALRSDPPLCTSLSTRFPLRDHDLLHTNQRSLSLRRAGPCPQPEGNRRGR